MAQLTTLLHVYRDAKLTVLLQGYRDIRSRCVRRNEKKMLLSLDGSADSSEFSFCMSGGRRSKRHMGQKYLVLVDLCNHCRRQACMQQIEHRNATKDMASIFKSNIVEIKDKQGST